MQRNTRPNPTPAIAKHTAFAIAATVTIAIATGWPASAWARGKGAAAQPAAVHESISPEVTEQYCEEERQRAHQWMAWAADKRSECKSAQGSAEVRAACLRQSLTQLDAFEKEHAEIYLNQVQNLKGDHPVVVNILKRLKSHKDLAGSILQEENAEPEALGSQLKHSCIAAAQQPLVRPRQR